MSKPLLRIGTIAALLLASGSVDARQGWSAPLGIPTPTFGVAEVRPALPSPWAGPAASFYFVCPSCAGATDSNNPLGHPGSPRQTIPSTVTGPAVVVLNGQINTNVSFNANGSAANPIFVTSYNPANPARLTGYVGATGGYVIFEQLWLGPRDAADSDFRFWLNEGSHHIALRNSELSGNLNRSGGIVLGTWQYAGQLSLSHIVIDHNTIHDIGNTAAVEDQDAHCVTINGSAAHVWVTHNTLTNCSGDALQIEANTGRRAFIHHIYYGRNQAHHNRQSGGWIKNATDVIFSQNVAHDFRQNSGGPGSCYGSQYDAEQIWFLFNEGYACNVGINIASSDASPGTFGAMIGNLIHDQGGQFPNDPYNGGAIVIRGGTNFFVANNSLVNVDAGVNMPPASTQAVSIQNNIIITPGRALYTNGALALTVDRNMYSTNATFTNAPSGTGALFGNPQFVSSTNYHLQSSSPAVNSGALSAVYAMFFSRYGIDITKDFDGSSRPVGAGWDLGAYEVGGDQTPPAAGPQPPSNLRIIR